MRDLAVVIQAAMACIQGVTAVLILGTLIVYGLILLVMQKQLTAMRQADLNQNTLALMQFLQAPELARARGVLIELSKTQKPLKHWSEDERESAERACAAYDLAGILIREGLVPESIIVKNWGNSIQKCHAAAAELLAELRASRGDEYWDDFDWLTDRARLVWRSA